MNNSLRVAFLTGGGLTHYCLLLANSLAEKGIKVYFVTGNNTLPEGQLNKNVKIVPIRGEISEKRSLTAKVIGILCYYWKLFVFITTAKVQVYHFQFYRFFFIEAVLFNTLIKILGKPLVYTAHNVWPHSNKGNWYYRISLFYIYRLCDAIICHNTASKNCIIHDFGINPESIQIIPLGIYQVVPIKGISRIYAKKIIVPEKYKEYPVLLFFGNISPYKGIEYLIKACKLLIDQRIHFFLVIAGNPGKNRNYWNSIKSLAKQVLPPDCIYFRPTYIPSDEIELFFRAADVVVLPYREIYQSAVHLLAFNYGTPVIATDIGSFKEDILEGKTGYVVPPHEVIALADAINKFIVEMLPHINSLGKSIREDATARFSWSNIAKETIKVYYNL